MAKSRKGDDAQRNQDRPLAVKPAKRRSKSGRGRTRKAGAPQLLGEPPGSSSSSEADDTVMSPAETEVSATTTASIEANGTADLIQTEFLSYENVDAAGLRSIALGHHGNIMPRHRKLLADIGSLILQNPKTEISDDRSAFLERAASSNVFYMEWFEPDECVYMWIGDRQGLFKLELHAVFESNSETFCYKNPLLSFSSGFDNGEHWNHLKHVLEEIFGSSQNKSIVPDCIYAFTRLGGTLHFHIYQVLDLEQSSVPNEMKLRKIAPSFAMKPLEVNSGLNCVPIFDSKKLIYEEESSLLNLEHMLGYVPSSGSLIKHIVEHSSIPNVLLLPCPRDLSQFNGFNSTLTEFIQRYPATYQDVVRGSNPETTYRDISDPFRVFSRSLILIVGEAIRHEICIKGLGMEKILLKRGVARLYGVEFIPYTEARALRMFGKIRRILKWCMAEGIPDDVDFVLRLLKDKPLENYNLIADSPVWIPAWDRCHYLEDTYSVFKSDLPFKSQIKFAKTKIQPLLVNWREKMEQNSLLDNVVSHNERMPKGYAKKTEEAQEKDREHVKNRKIAALRQTILDQENLMVSDATLCSLLTCQEFFAKCRHSVVHLPEAARVHGLLPMPPETKNFIVTSQFAAVYPLIQEGLCKVLSKTPEELGLTKYFKTDVTSDLL
ncbi:hypothetical protein ACQ4PT_055082 [Festuca glaucescens]